MSDALASSLAGCRRKWIGVSYACALLGLLMADITQGGQLTVLDVITFDPTTADLYWSGHKLTPPVTFIYDGTILKANGVPAASPVDTAGSASRLAPRFGHIPVIDSLVRHNLSYIEALNEY